MKKNTSILTKKLTREVLKKYFLLMILFFLLLIITISPVIIISESKKLEEKTEFISAQYEQTLTAIESQMNSFVTSTELDSLLQNYRNDPQKSSRELINQALQSYQSSFRQISYCMIEGPDNSFFSPFTNGLSPASTICREDPYYQNLKNAHYFSYYSRIYTPLEFYSEQYNSTFGNTIYTSRSLLKDDSRYIYTLFYKVDNLVSNCESARAEAFDSYCIINRNKERIYSISDTDTDLYSSDILNSIHTQKGKLYNVGGIYYYKNISYFGWTIITHISWFQLFSPLYSIVGILLIFFILVPLIFYRLIVSLNTQYLAPLSDLTDQISQYSAGQDIKTNIMTGDEIEVLSRSVDKMILKINAQIEDIKERERQNCITHYSLLATQIDPHFIYNTLNIINILARQNGQDDIVAINTALSKILRERFSVKATIFDEIENELDTLKQYCTIMKYRYQNNIHIDINAESGLLHEKIPKNLLLPIVENSFYHGLSNEDDFFRGNIDISIYSIDQRIVVEISDDGKGISKEKLDYIKENKWKSPDKDRTHIGLSNVYERLCFIYHDDFSFDISSTLGYGTTCSIVIPFYSKEMKL